MKRTPWYNARTQPPVNGGPGALYEVLHERTIYKVSVSGISRLVKLGADCRWRGLTKKVSK